MGLWKSATPFLRSLSSCTSHPDFVGVWSATTGLFPGTQSGDGQDHYVPARTFSAAILRTGSLPEWNPYIYTGYPHIADVQNGFFYPPNLILYQVFSGSTAYTLSIFFNLFLTVFFTSCFLRLFVRSNYAIWIGSATFALAGFLAYNAVTVTIPDSAAWVPAVFWCVEKWMRTGRWKYCAWGGVCLAMQLLAGWPQMVLLTVIYLGVYLLFALRSQPKPIRILTGVVVLGVIAAGLGVPQLLATLQLKDQSIIQHLSYTEYVFSSVAPQLAILLFFPFLVGVPVPVAHLHSVGYYAPISSQVNVYYVGILPLMLAIAAFFLWRRSRYVRFGGTTALLALLLSWGGYTPLARVLYRLPVYNFFHDHRINLIFFAFGIAVLAACAVDGIDFPGLSLTARRRLGWGLPAATIAAAAIMLIRVRWLFRSMDPQVGVMQEGWLTKLHHTARLDNPDVMLSVLIILVSAALFYAWTKYPGSSRIGVMAVALVIADLVYFGVSGQWAAVSVSPTANETAALTMMNQLADHQEFRSVSLVKWPYPAISPNLTGESHHADILGLGPFMSKRHALLLTSLNVGTVRHWRELMINNTVLSLLNTRYIEMDSGQLAEITRVLGPFQASARADAHGAPASVNLVGQAPWMNSLSEKFVTPPPSIPACTRKNCETAGVPLSLDPNSAYELTFKARNTDPARGVGSPTENGFGGGFPRPGSGEYFAIMDWMLNRSQDYNLYTHLYLSDDHPGDVSFYFINYSRSPLDLKDVSLRKIGSFPLGSNPYRVAGHFGGLYVVENPNVYPRAFFVSSVQAVPSFIEARSELWRTIEPFDARHRALVEAPANQLPATVTEGNVESLTYSPNRTDLDVSCPGTCYLVLSDMYYPGWIASVDGQTTAIFLTDAMVRGIVVPAGKHHVEFAYHPRSFRIGMLFSLATLGVVVLITVRSGKNVATPDGGSISASS